MNRPSVDSVQDNVRQYIVNYMSHYFNKQILSINDDAL